ncbi:MAG: PAS domain-containing protein [Desulfobacterales bacterium]
MPEKPPVNPSPADLWLGKDHRLSRMLDDAGAGIFFLDRQGRFVRTNAAMCHRLLFAPGTLEGESALDLLEKKTPAF